jgi:hypothetical protein
MADPLSDFLERPSGESFVRLRAAVLAEPSYDFHADDDAELNQLVEEGEDEVVVGRLPQLMPNWLLSPRVHQMLGDAAQRSGDAETAQREHYFARAALRGLLESGDGSRERPYLVTHIADEYDLLSALGKEAESQSQAGGPSGVCDVIACRDGSELWFDVTPGFTQPVA